jgi:hypothetical protein
MNTKAIASKVNITVGIATGYGMDGPQFESRLGHEILSSPKPPKPALGPTQPSIGRVPAVKRSKLTTRFPQVPRLRMSGAISLLPLYAFVAWTATKVPLFQKENTVGYVTTNDATTYECYNEQFLSIKSGYYNEYSSYN